MAFSLDQISQAFSEGILGDQYDPDKTILGMNPANLAVLGGRLGKAIAGDDTVAGRIGDIGVDLGRSRIAADASAENRDFFTKLLSSTLTAPGELGATAIKAGKDGRFTMDFDIPGSAEAEAGIASVPTPTSSASGAPVATSPVEPTEPVQRDDFRNTLGGQFSNF